CADVRPMDRRRQLVDERWDRRDLTTGKSLREVVREMRCELVREHRTEDRNADGAAHGAEERRARRRDAEVFVVGCVLNGEHQYLHYEAESEAEHEHVDV